MEKEIFRKGSKTFYWSSLFFPKSVRKDVFDLYSFVRIADDYVDIVPAQTKQFYELKKLYTAAISTQDFDTARQASDSQNLRVVKNMVRLSHKYDFEQKWVEDFLDAMESDLNFKPFKNQKNALLYVHGSAETVGCMMARIMGASKHAERSAQMLGRSLQQINFIRDIAEDNSLGRCYFNNTDLAEFKLKNICEDTARANPEAFEAFMHYQVTVFRKWLGEAKEGFEHIPWRCRVPIKTATDMYEWTANQIEQNPWIVYEKKIKPSRLRALRSLLTNSL